MNRRLSGLLLAAAAPLAAAQGVLGDWRSAPPPQAVEPRWALELKQGDFKPSLPDWAAFYGEEETRHRALAFGYKPLRALEVGLEVGQMHDVGVGELPLGGGTGGEVDYRLRPVHAYLLLRLVFGEDQGAVPYVGAGVTRAYYRQRPEGEAARKGEADGRMRRYGLQLLLDPVDEPLAREAGRGGLKNSYLFVERHRFDAEVDGIDLGGETTFIGLLFEF